MTTSELKPETLRPGSPEAVAAGCRCTRKQNCRGKGIGGDGETNGWWVNGECPIHGGTMKEV